VIYKSSSFALFTLGQNYHRDAEAAEKTLEKLCALSVSVVKNMPYVKFAKAL
jgi:hypothetical protein